MLGASRWRTFTASSLPLATRRHHRRRRAQLRAHARRVRRRADGRRQPARRHADGVDRDLRPGAGLQTTTRRTRRRCCCCCSRSSSSRPCTRCMRKPWSVAPLVMSLPCDRRSVRTRLSTAFTLDVAFVAPAGHHDPVRRIRDPGRARCCAPSPGCCRPTPGASRSATACCSTRRRRSDVPAQQRRRRLRLSAPRAVSAPDGRATTSRTDCAHAPGGTARRASRDRDVVPHRRTCSTQAAGAISGGERQRAALARSLVTDPAVLLLDEPLSALDHATQSRIIDDLRAWNAAHGIPILYVTHAHREVFALGERVVVAGARTRWSPTGTPHEVLELAGITSRWRSSPASKICSTADGRRRARRRPGTMQCRLGDSSGRRARSAARARGAGGRVRIAIRAGDILLADRGAARAERAQHAARRIVVAHASRARRCVADVDAGARFVVHLTPARVDDHWACGPARASGWSSRPIRAGSCRDTIRPIPGLTFHGTADRSRRRRAAGHRLLDAEAVDLPGQGPHDADAPAAITASPTRRSTGCRAPGTADGAGPRPDSRDRRSSSR